MTSLEILDDTLDAGIHSQNSRGQSSEEEEEADELHDDGA